MATATHLSPVEYLKTTFDGVDKEYVRGRLIERAMPTKTHSRLQYRICRRIEIESKQAGLSLEPFPELRLQVEPEIFRIPDVSVFSEEPKEIPDTPPLIAIEILSDEDRHSRLIEKLEDYRRFGIPNIWIVDPQLRRLYVYDGNLRPVSALELPGGSAVLSAEELFAEI